VCISYTLHREIFCFRKFSRAETEEWPKEALNFCNRCIEILQPEDLNEQNGWLVEWQNQDSSSTCPLKELQTLRKSLVDLDLIRQKLVVKLSLDEYNQVNLVELYFVFLYLQFLFTA
jgi:hypothetical protein